MTKDELQKEIDRLNILLGLAFMLIPNAKRAVFFERAKDLRKLS